MGTPARFIYELTESDTIAITIKILASSVEGAYVLWGDDSYDSIYTTSTIRHTYTIDPNNTIPISYIIEISGYDVIGLDLKRGIKYLKSVITFGNLPLKSLSRLFQNAINLTSVPTLLPSTVTNLEAVFSYSNFNHVNIKKWKTQNVTNMKNMFFRATNFNQDLSYWNISKIISMENAFKSSALSATNFDKMLISWAKKTVKNNVKLGAPYYTNRGLSSFNKLKNTYQWKISARKITARNINPILKNTNHIKIIRKDNRIIVIRNIIIS